MATSDTNFLLVEVNAGEGLNSCQWPIKKVIRSYLSERRAEQDRDLLGDANPSSIYVVLNIHHIDD